MKIFSFWLGGWFTYWAIGSAVVSAAGQVYSSSQAKKNAGNVAQYNPVDLGQVQKDTIQGNLSNSDSIEQLISRGNAFNTSQAINIQNQVMPGYQALSKSLSDRAQTLASHPYDVPQEVQDNIARIAAEKGISAGTRGQFNDFSLLRDFGVNELAYGQSNIQQSQQLTGLLAAIAPKVNPMSPLSFYVTPAQGVATVSNNNAQAQAIAQGQINAQNAATNAGNADVLGSLTKLAGLFSSTKSTNNSEDIINNGLF